MKTTPETQQTIETLHQKGIGIRQISRMLKLSRKTVRRILRKETHAMPVRRSRYQEVMPMIRELFSTCQGNVVRIKELLSDNYHHDIPYSSLTRLIRELGLRTSRKKQRSGAYSFAPGQEMQHDTSAHRIVLGGRQVKAQCAGCVCAFSSKLFVQYYPAFTRFEARVFLTEAFRFMDGTCRRCVIDNTSVIVAHGTGPDAEIAPEMEAFGHIFGIVFVPHRIGHADRKAKMERNFFYVQQNFLAGRTFCDWHDLNRQARTWCIEVANKKPKRSLGMSPEAAYVIEKPHLQPLPPSLPPVYTTLHRIVDVEGYITVDTNRYSVPERLLGKKVEVHKTWDHVIVFFQYQKVAEHPRCIDKRAARMTAPGHHSSFRMKKAHRGSSQEERALRGHSDLLDSYVKEIKQRSRGRGIRQLRRLLDLKRTYPEDAFNKAIHKAFHFAMYDLSRLEHMILSYVAGDFFTMSHEDE